MVKISQEIAFMNHLCQGVKNVVDLLYLDYFFCSGAGEMEEVPEELAGRVGSNFGHFLRGGNGRGGIPHPGERYNVSPRWCRDTRTVTQVRHHLLC